MAVTVQRAPLSAPLSPMQEAVVMLIALGHTYGEIAEFLHLDTETVRYHTRAAADKMPGDLESRMKVIVWMRGASADVLTGATLKLALMEQMKFRVTGSVLNELRPHGAPTTSEVG